MPSAQTLEPKPLATCPFCPDSPLSNLAVDSSSKICMTCDRTFEPDYLDRHPLGVPTEHLMRGPAIPEGSGGGGRSRGRRESKPGMRDRSDVRFEQEGFSLETVQPDQDEEALEKQFNLKCDKDMHAQVKAVAKAKGWTTGRALRVAWNQFMAAAASGSSSEQLAA